MKRTPMSSTLRLAGFWIIWSAWCSASGWLLSAVHELDGYGYTALLPVLLGAGWLWLRSTATCPPSVSGSPGNFFRRFRHPAPLVFLLIAALSLSAGCLYPPWSSDAINYRLPRLLYWWSAHQWYWIGTLDHRLDYSSVGFEWQMLPVIILTRTDRFLFLLNWIPYLLMPGLVFMSFRGLGLNGRSSRRWMWLLPAGYCFALQCSGVQNDGYAVNYLLAAVVFAVIGYHTGELKFIVFSVVATAVLTGAKLSNLPLLLPLGIILWPALRRVKPFNWKTPIGLIVALFVSAVPMTYLCWKISGDWTGDPTNQWGIKSSGPVVGIIVANVIILLNDFLQPPFLPASDHFNALLSGINHSSFFDWLKGVHHEFEGVRFGNMAYEGLAGLGCGVQFYALFTVIGALVLRMRRNIKKVIMPVPFEWRLAPWLGWLVFFVYLSKLGDAGSARIAAPYYPLLFVPLLRSPAIALFERKKIAAVVGGFAAATVLFVIILTPARPLLPVQTIAQVVHRHGVQRLAEGYELWDHFRDNLASVRASFPPDATRIGYAGGFLETPYGLFKPLGSRSIIELGLPPGSSAPPPPGLTYAVVTDEGLKLRYNDDLETWLGRFHGQVMYKHTLNTALNTHETTNLENWYLIRLDPQQRQ